MPPLLLLALGLLACISGALTVSSANSFPSAVWMDSREREMVEKHLSPHMTMLEYGSGASTLHFSRRVKAYYSVEHDLTWCASLRPLLEHLNLTSVHYHCEGMNEGVPAPECFQVPGGASNHKTCRSSYAQYKNYIEAPAQFNVKFDAVLVDGRARPQCAIFAADLLASPSSIVFIHDWNERSGYHEVLQVYDIVEQQKESTQPGGGGLVVLRRKMPPAKMTHFPVWWFQ
eukprot:m.534820 g.534820  ORF g.534820 m.534820 type:complete len:230 (-) comp57608_c0_seq36:133-822(-)